MTESSEQGKKEQYRKVNNENQQINLVEAINNIVNNISLDYNKASGRFSRHGLPWYAQKLFFESQAQNPNEIKLTLNSYYNFAIEIIKNSPLLQGLDINTEEGRNEISDRLIANKNSSEYWAGRLIDEINSLFNNPNIEEKEIQKVLWEMNKLTNFHSMLIFKESLEPTIWSGYMINNLKNILEIWANNQENDKELFWQEKFSENSIILSQAFSFPVISIEGSIYVGGKNLKNKGANLVDFLFKNNLTKNTALVEIKAPTTKIIAKEYRAVYSITTDISGAIVQISNYKHSLIKDYRSLIEDEEEEEKINAFNPQCIVIAGNAKAELTSKKHIKSFELFRNGLRDVQLITYDELFNKIEILVNLIEGKK